MNDKQRLEIMNLCREIEKKSGEGSIYSLGRYLEKSIIKQYSCCKVIPSTKDSDWYKCLALLSRKSMQPCLDQ